jgi:hypothetical protein
MRQDLESVLLHFIVTNNLCKTHLNITLCLFSVTPCGRSSSKFCRLLHPPLTPWLLVLCSRLPSCVTIVGVLVAWMLRRWGDVLRSRGILWVCAVTHEGSPLRIGDSQNGFSNLNWTLNKIPPSVNTVIPTLLVDLQQQTDPHTFSHSSALTIGWFIVVHNLTTTILLHITLL